MFSSETEIEAVIEMSDFKSDIPWNKISNSNFGNDFGLVRTSGCYCLIKAKKEFDVENVDLINIEVNCIHQVKVTPNHLFLVLKNTRNLIWSRGAGVFHLKKMLQNGLKKLEWIEAQNLEEHDLIVDCFEPPYPDFFQMSTTAIDQVNDERLEIYLDEITFNVITKIEKTQYMGKLYDLKVSVVPNYRTRVGIAHSL